MPESKPRWYWGRNIVEELAQYIADDALALSVTWTSAAVKLIMQGIGPSIRKRFSVLNISRRRLPHLNLVSFPAHVVMLGYSLQWYFTNICSTDVFDCTRDNIWMI